MCLIILVDFGLICVGVFDGFNVRDQVYVTLYGGIVTAFLNNFDGLIDGNSVGFVVRIIVVVCILGDSEGIDVPISVNDLFVGDEVGIIDGDSVGIIVGDSVRKKVGVSVGILVGISVGVSVGVLVREMLGNLEGFDVGIFNVSIELIASLFSFLPPNTYIVLSIYIIP